MDVQNVRVLLNVHLANKIIIWMVFANNVLLDSSYRALFALHATVLVQIVKMKQLIVYLVNQNTT